MYLFPISDLHVGINAHCLVSNFISNHFKFLNKYKDIVVCACGDIGPGLAGYVFLDKLQKTFPHIKIVYVLGNHEYYGHQINSIYDECALTNLTGNENIVILDGKHANNYVINGINFIGCTLWTDFNKGNAEVMNRSQRVMNDYRCIMQGDRRITPEYILNTHGVQMKGIIKELNRETGYKNVVLTHHVPIESQPFIGGLEHYAYYSDLWDKIIATENPPVYWFYGHDHKSAYIEKVDGDKKVTFCSNPVGYYTETTTGYSTKCVLEI